MPYALFLRGWFLVDSHDEWHGVSLSLKPMEEYVAAMAIEHAAW